MKLDFSSIGKARVVGVTVLGSIGCVAAALIVDSFTFAAMDHAAKLRAITVDILLPIALAAPLLAFLMSKLRQLALAHRELSIIASTDSLTTVLNRGAFTMMVEAYLERFRDDRERSRGALLVVDADNFKTINDDYGHSFGDGALKIIARSIREALREGDLVGRVGGDEFSVFLPGSNLVQARMVAERIRQSVMSSGYGPPEKPSILSISIGVAIFGRAVGYAELFAAADRLLYLAKAEGRNLVMVGDAPAGES